MRLLWMRLFAGLFVLASFAAAGAPGQLDPTFGAGGIELLDFGAPSSVRIVASARQADGKIVVAGSISQRSSPSRKIAVGRLNEDGTPDSSFGANGWAYFYSGSYDMDFDVRGVAVSPEGKIVVIGGSGPVFLVRFEASGVIDQTFGVNQPGLALDYVGFGESPRAVGILPGGEIVVTGLYAPNPYFGETYVTRYQASNGHRDFAFGNLGTVRLSLGGPSGGGRAILTRPDGSFFVAGSVTNFTQDAVVTKVLSNGTADFSFGNSGSVAIDFDNYDDEAFALALDGQGKLLVGGKSGGSTAQFAIARLDAATGALDPNLYGTGKVRVAIAPDAVATVTSIAALALPEDGFVAFGTANFPQQGRSNFAMARFQPNGLPWPWGMWMNGAVILPSNFVDESVTGYVTTDARLVALGSRLGGMTQTLLVARYVLNTGDLDSEFPMGGFSSTKPYLPSDDYAVSANRMPDGRFTGIMSSDLAYAIFRVMPDGSADPSFGSNGSIAFERRLPDQSPRASAVQPDGKLVVLSLADVILGGGSFYNAASLTRFNLDGTRDVSFNYSGDLMITMAGQTTALALQPDGKIVVAIQTLISTPGGYRNRIGLARVTPDGAFDPAFGGGGTLIVDRPGVDNEYPDALAVQADGKIVVGSRGTMTSDSIFGFMAVRLMPNGALDPSWGTGGAARATTGSELNAIALQPDGKVLLGGGCPGSTMDACVVRFDAAGMLDATFNGSGLYLLQQPQDWDRVKSLALQSDGKIVAAATLSGRLTLIGLSGNGAPDPGFNGGISAIGFPFADATAVLLQPDGKLVAFGTTQALGDHDLLMARFEAEGDSTPDPFTFTDVTGVPPFALITSNPVTITGIAQPASIAVQGGEYSIGCMEPFVTAPGMIANGQFVCVRHRASETAGGVTNTTLTVGGVSDTFSSVTSIPPDTTITASPPNPSGSRTASFSFVSTADPNTSGFECALDGAPWASCGSPTIYNSLGDGPHTFQVRSFGPGGLDPTPASYTWQVDVNVLDTTITNYPGGSSDTYFEFAANDATATFECSLDGAPFAACASPHPVTGLSDGSHHFEVRARTGTHLDETPAFTNWVVDATPPDTILLGGPSGTVASTTATFTFAASEEGAVLVCGLDGAPLRGPCPSPTTYTGLSQGPHTFVVAAFDGVGNVDPTPVTVTWTVDTGAPETTITSAPSLATSSQTSTFTFVSSEPGSTFECQRDNSAYAPCASPTSYAGLVEGPHVFRVRAIDAAGNVDPAPAEHDWFIDLTAPDTLITSGPMAQWPSASATVTFQATEAGSTFQCALDGAAYATCASPVGYTGLADGAHELLVRAVDGVGNVDATPSVIDWNVDTVAPQTTITGGPTGTTSQALGAFTFVSSEIPATFECRFDGGSFAACPSPASFSGLAPGSHTFEVRAIDAAGNVDATPDARTWTIDSSAPDTTITLAPASPSASSSASFSFTSTELPATFECNLDGQGWSACTSPKTYSGLLEAMHQFQVRASDAAGNVDGSPASYQWLVDTTAPDTTITSGPSGIVTTTSATFSFTSNDAGATFECRLDGAAFAACASSQAYTGLGQGAHTFDARAKDNAGNLDATPASRSWSVDTAAPETTITSGPSGAVASTSASFTFTASESPVAFECRLDGATFASCTSPRSFSALAQGSHTFEVRSRDPLGNLDASPASRTWTVDTVTPTTTITSGPPSNTTATTATFTFISNEPGVTFECKLDSAAFAACTTPKTYNGLSRTSHTFQVRARDAAGNLDPSPASDTWRVR